MSREPFNLMLEDVRDLAPGVKHFSFSREDGEPLDFVPGQFVQLIFDHEGGKVRRSYSIASVPGRDETIDMAVAAVEGGIATRHFWAMQEGDRVDAMGPFGRLVLRDEPSRVLLVATGTGIAPYRTMLPEISRRLEEGRHPEVRLMHGVRRREDLLYGEEFVRFADEHPGFTYTAHYSREKLSDPQAWEREGYVQHAFADLDTDPETDVVYLCGNPNMIDEAFAWLVERGFSTKQIRREKYISGA